MFFSAFYLITQSFNSISQSGSINVEMRRMEKGVGKVGIG